jgi:hypothetical protein
MPATHTHDISIKVGEYTTGSGEKKYRTRHIGRAFTTDEGRIFLRIDAEQLNPITASLARAKGEDSVILNLWPSEAKDKPAAASAAAAADGDDIPF